MNQLTNGRYSKLFSIAALWNICIAGCCLLLPGLMNKLAFKAEVVPGVATFALILTWSLVFVYGIGYYFVSRNTEENRGIVWMGILGKMAFFFTALIYYLKDIITLLTMFLCFGDFVFACLFIFFLVKTRD